MEQTQTTTEQAEQELPSTTQDLSEGERQVVNHLASVSAQSVRFDGMCGRITNVRFDDDVEEPEELKRSVQRLTRETDVAQDQIVDTGAADNIANVQDKLREMVGLKPEESRDIILTVQLPDGRSFNERFDAPTFDSDKHDNRFQTLYKDILGLNEIQQDGLEGEVVPVKEEDTRERTDGAKYEIDFSYANKTSIGSDVSVTDKISIVPQTQSTALVALMAVVLYGFLGMVLLLELGL